MTVALCLIAWDKNENKKNNMLLDTYIDCVHKNIITTAIVVKIMIMIIQITIMINPNYYKQREK